jgi:hypothetical protein
MFDFIKERKASAALEAVAARIPATLKSLTRVERCAGMAFANAYLLSRVPDYGGEFALAPMKIRREFVVDAVSHLTDLHRQKTSAAERLRGRSERDPVFSAWKWEIFAVELLMVTVGCSISEAARSAARSTWGDLKTCKIFADDAVDALQLYAKAYSLPPVPPVKGRENDAKWLKSLAANLPPMFLSKEEKADRAKASARKKAAGRLKPAARRQ